MQVKKYFKKPDFKKEKLRDIVVMRGHKSKRQNIKRRYIYMYIGEGKGLVQQRLH